MAAKVTVKVVSGAISKIAKSDEMAAALEPAADEVLERVLSDSNDAFTATVRKKLFRSSGRAGRVVWQIGAAPKIGLRVEAKRGVFARAVAFLKG